MGRSISVAGAVVLGCACLSGQAIAACSGASLNQTQLGNLLTGNTVCASRGSDRWQTLHQSGFDLIDFKLGPNHAVDPSKKVGTWSIGGSGSNRTIIYNYGSGGSFAYTVRSNGGNSYSYCVGTAELVVTVKTGGGSCPQVSRTGTGVNHTAGR